MTPSAKSSGKSRSAPRSGGAHEGPPPYDPVAVGRVAQRVEIVTIELLEAYFDREDNQPVPRANPRDVTPEIGVSVEWKLSTDKTTLGCIVTFGTQFDGKPPYRLVATFRNLYSVSEGAPLKRAELAQFAHWNAVYNAWPYWREYLSSTINRAQLPRFILPVMRVPRPAQSAVRG